MNGIQFFFTTIFLLISLQKQIEDINIYSFNYEISHAIYISVCELEYESQSINIKIKTFTNDLEDAIHNQTGEAISIDNQLNSTITHSKISDYLLAHVNFSIDKKPLKPELIKVQKENDATWSYFHVKNVSAFTNLEIRNNLFLELFETQQNIVSISYNTEKKFLRLDKNKTEEIVAF